MSWDVIETQRMPQAGKNVLVRFAGGLRPAEQLLISPGITASEVLDKLGMSKEDFYLSKGDASGIFTHSANLYQAVNDGDDLYCSTRVDCGV